MRYLLPVLCLCSPVALGLDATPGLVASRPESGRFVETEQGFMVPYDVQIPETSVVFHMEPIPGGEITVGTDRRRYRVDPFWMGRFEVTWAEYRQFMDLYHAFKQFQIRRERTVNEDNRLDAITAPTPLYEPTYTFEYGEDPQQPAVTVTQYSAKQYTKWMTAITGQQFRLPAEAEWEHACRAGASTPWYFGDSVDSLGAYAWFDETSDGEGTRPVGQKKPNEFGLYDMHGNAAELVLDGPDGIQPAGDQVLDAATDWIRAATPDQRKVCGGSWESTGAECQATSRLLTVHQDWKDIDPNIPKSPWWFTDDPARGVGFRLLRPLKAVARPEMEEYWKNDNEMIQLDVFDRVDEGRGVRGLVDRDLPQAIKSLDESR